MFCLFKTSGFRTILNKKVPYMFNTTSIVILFGLFTNKTKHSTKYIESSTD